MTKNTLKVQPIALTLILTLNLTVIITTVFALPNPAAVYCQALEYEYDNGQCKLPNGQYVDAWEFLAGTVAQEWSYCAKEGYDIKHLQNSEVCRYCAVCVLPDGKEADVTELMGLVFITTCGDGKCRLPENLSTCPADCPSGEWDDYCDGIEDDKCDPDCAQSIDPDCEAGKICGSGFCDGSENYSKCPQDCPSGQKDDYCDGVRDGKCDPDCSDVDDADCKNDIVAVPFLYPALSLLQIAGCITILVTGAIILIVWRKQKTRTRFGK